MAAENQTLGSQMASIEVDNASQYKATLQQRGGRLLNVGSVDVFVNTDAGTVLVTGESSGNNAKIPPGAAIQLPYGCPSFTHRTASAAGLLTYVPVEALEENPSPWIDLLRVKTDKGAGWQIQSISEEVAVAAAAVTDSTLNLLPTNALVLDVTARVTTLIPTAATFKLGIAGQDDKFGSGILVAANTTFVSSQQGGAFQFQQGAAAAIRITPNVQPAAATGKVRITVFYIVTIPPQS